MIKLRENFIPNSFYPSLIFEKFCEGQNHILSDYWEQKNDIIFILYAKAGDLDDRFTKNFSSTSN